MKFVYAPGATPLDLDEAKDLKVKWISTQSELNVAEQQNIIQAQQWIESRKAPKEMNRTFLCALHRKMFGDVWRWAGEFRKTDKNIGVPWTMISLRLHEVIGDLTYWLEHDSFEDDEIVARFHHRLVSVHCFPNGNGRHARLAADVLMKKMGGKPLTWGNESLNAEGADRTRYLEALREADQHRYVSLIQFVRR